LYVKGKEDTFLCACGYKEKLSAFTARREKEGAGVSKKDVQRYLNKQKKEAEEPINSAFADAFAKLKLYRKMQGRRQTFLLPLFQYMIQTLIQY
ncbi:hypothetical protein ABTK14_20615, partial [Acinetobacter baumannii]